MDDDKEGELLRQQVKEMREAMAVDSAMTLRDENRIKEHQQWLEEVELAEARHRKLTVEHHQFIAQHEAMMIRIEENIQKLTELILGGRTKNGN